MMMMMMMMIIIIITIDTAREQPSVFSQLGNTLFEQIRVSNTSNYGK